MGRAKRIWYLSPMRAAKVQASLRIRAVSPEPSLLAHTSSESRETFRQKARSLAPLNGWACAVEMCHDGMLEDTNSLDGAQMKIIAIKIRYFLPVKLLNSAYLILWHMLCMLFDSWNAKKWKSKIVRLLISDLLLLIILCFTGPRSSVGRVSASGNERSQVWPGAATYQSLKMVLIAPCMALRLTG